MAFNDEEKRDCIECHGMRTVTKTEQEQDTAMGFALGAATGIGYFPSWHTVTKTVDCPRCNGSGKERF